LWLIFVLRVFGGAVFAAFYTATIVAMSSSVDPRRSTVAMGVFVVTLLGGMSIGPVIGGYANDATHSKLTSFYLASLIFLLTAVLGYFLVPVGHEKEEGASEEAAVARSLLSGVWLGLKSIPDYMILAFIIYFPTGLLFPITKLFAMDELHMSEAQYGLLFVVGAAVVGVIAIGSSKIIRLWGRERSIHIGLAVSAVGMLGVALIHDYLLIVLFAGLTGLGFVVSLPAWLAMVSGMADPRVRGSVIGALGVGQGLGLIAGVVLAGHLYTSVSIDLLGLKLNSHHVPFFVCGLALIVSFAMSVLFVRKGRERHISLEEFHRI
jgi:DHA1 family multidrug resistance protein-like MFS transporter